MKVYYYCLCDKTTGVHVHTATVRADNIIEAVDIAECVAYEDWDNTEVYEIGLD